MNVYTLCDIGNTNADILSPRGKQKIPLADFIPEEVEGDVYFISVNQAFEERINGLERWHNLRGYVDWNRYYPTMGIDRVMVCEAVGNGIIVDAGSAITVDRMVEGNYEGGFIALGLQSARKAYGSLSTALDVPWNFEVDLDKMAKNTPDAVVIGYLSPLVSKIRSLGNPLYLTGGDALRLASYFDEPYVKDDLIFEGMKKLIEKGKPC